jgi:rhamnosyltransferase
MMEKVIGALALKNSEIPLLKKAIQSYRGQMEGLVLIDCGSRPEITKEVKQIVAESAGFVTGIWDSEDIGYSGSLNKCLRLAVERGAAWAITLLDDTVLHPDTVAAMLKAYHALPPETQKTIGLIMPNVTSIRGLAWPDGEPFINDDGGNTEAQMIKATMFPIVGYMDEALCGDGIDGEFSFRVRMHGFKSLRVPHAVAETRWGHPVMRRFLWKMAMIQNYQPYRYYYMSRNLVYLFVRKFRVYTLHTRPKDWINVVWAVIIPRYFIKVVLFEDNRKAKIRACFIGWWDGIRGHLGPIGDRLEPKPR